MNEVVFLNIQFVTHTIRIAVKLFCTPALPVLMRFEAMLQLRRPEGSVTACIVSRSIICCCNNLKLALSLPAK